MAIVVFLLVSWIMLTVLTEVFGTVEWRGMTAGKINTGVRVMAIARVDKVGTVAAIMRNLWCTSDLRFELVRAAEQLEGIVWTNHVEWNLTSKEARAIVVIKQMLKVEAVRPENRELRSVLEGLVMLLMPD